MTGHREGITAPMDQQLHRLLRRAVLDFGRSETRRVHLPVLHVGTPGGPQAVFADRRDQVSDHALRADIVAAMVRRARQGGTAPLVWLTRPGELVLQDVDVRWMASSRAAYAEARLPLVMVVVNRHGWRDPRSGLGRSWVRLRERGAGAPGDRSGPA